MEISIILDNKVVYSKEFKNKAPDHNKIVEMEYKFINLVESDKSVKYLYSIAQGIIIAACNTSMVSAADLANTSDKIKVGFNPIIELLADLGYPVAYCMFIVAALMIITGKKSKGLEILKWAAIGYIGLQVVPFFLGVLDQIGKDLRSSLK